MSKILGVLKFHKGLLRDVRKIVNPDAYDIAMDDCNQAIKEVEKLTQPCIWEVKTLVPGRMSPYDPMISFISCVGTEYRGLPQFCPDCGRKVKAENV